MNSTLPGRQSGIANGPAIPPPTRTAFLESLHLIVLTTFAVTQPVYDRLGNNPAFVSDSGIDLSGLLLLVLLLSVVIPGGLAGTMWLAGRLAPRARHLLYPPAIFVLWVLIALPIAKRIEPLDIHPLLVIGPALMVGAAATWAYFAFRPLRSIVTVGALGTIAFPILFLFFSRVWWVISAMPALHTEQCQPVPVVVVVFDEFRGTSLLDEAGEVDEARFPHFAELARHTTRYRNATTVHHDTNYAVPAILSGRYPSTALAPSAADLPQNLFSILESTGAFRFAVFEPVSRLASDRFKVRMTRKPALIQAAEVVSTLVCVYLVHVSPSALQRDLPEIPRLWFGLHASEEIDRTKRRGVFRYFWGKDRNEQFEHFLDCLDRSADPTLYFNHVLLPHVPWCYVPSGRRYLAESNRWELLEFDTHSPISDFWGTDELFVVQSQQRQLLQLQYTDNLVGRLLERLRESELYDKCLLIVTADHGISFAIGDSRRYPTQGNLADIMSVPLFVKLPGQQMGSISDRNVEAIDILPTIMDVLGIELSFPIDGQSMLDTKTPERSTKTMYRGLDPQAVPAAVVSHSTAGHELRSRFGPSGDPAAMFRIGPHSEFIGRDVAELSLADGPPIELQIIRGGSRYSTDRGSLIPCYIEGRVMAPAGFGLPVTLAVAVNGVIRATTRTYLLDGLRTRWAAMVPEAAYQEGENDIQYYAVAEEAPNLRWVRCRTSVTSR